MHVEIQMLDGAGFTAASTTVDGKFGCPLVERVKVACAALPAPLVVEYDKDLNEIRVLIGDECVYSILSPPRLYVGCDCGEGNQTVIHRAGCAGMPVLS